MADKSSKKQQNVRIPLVSIVTITYNHSKFIRQALDSFLSQKVNFPIEIVIADDASKDDTQKIISEYAKKYPEIIRPILRKKNIGAVPNSIDSLRHARGTYIALCEGDDYWIDDHKLQKQVDYFKKHTKAAVCFSPTKVIYETGDQKSSVWPDRFSAKDVSIHNLILENFIPTNSVMFKRQDYSKLCADAFPFDWYLHLYHAQFGDIGFLPDVMAVYRRHESGMWWSSDNSPVEHWEKYGAAMFTLLEEVRKMYAHRLALRSAVAQSNLTLIQRLLKADTTEGLELSASIVKHAHTATLDSLKLLIGQVDELSKRNQLLTEGLTKSKSNEQALIEANSHLKLELSKLRDSKVIGKVIKTREKMGKIEQRVRRSSH